ncbi:IPT/TIG domain-containing protein [Candidatus Microgenomates bacterium]|nr:IPT/TIG domain-containing protein [Candidatus Microgenomates bacterium]
MGSFLTFKNIVILAVVGILAVSIPVTLRLAQQQTQLKSKAAELEASVCVSYSVDTAGKPIYAGQSYPAQIVMENKGATTWSKSTGYRLGSQDPPDNYTWGLNRVDLPPTTTVPPGTGSKHTFSFIIKAPSTPGQYPFSWQMLKEGAYWFGSKCSPTFTVSSASTTPSPSPSTSPGTGTISVSPTSITQKSDGSWPELSISVSTISTDTWKVFYYYPGVCGSGCTVSEGWIDIREGRGNSTFNWTPSDPSYKGQHSIALMKWVAGQNPVIWNKDTVTFTPYSGGGTGGKGSNAAGSIVSLSPEFVSRQDSGGWKPVTITYSISNAEGTAKLLYLNSGTCVFGSTCNPESGWTSIASGIAEGSNQTYNWTPRLTENEVATNAKRTIGLFSAGADSPIKLVATKDISFSLFDGAECQATRQDTGGPVFYQEGTNTKASSIRVGTRYDVEIKMYNKDLDNPLAALNTWLSGPVPSTGTSDKYFLGFPTAGPPTDFGAGQFVVNDVPPAGEGGVEAIWKIDWPVPTKLRLPLSKDVKPGDSNTFRFKVTPQKVGLQTFYWSMVHEGVAWFGGECTTERINVEPASAGGTPTPGQTPTLPPGEVTPTPDEVTPPPAPEGTACYLMTWDLLEKNRWDEDGFEGCDDSEAISYDEDPVKLGYTFETPGVKTIYVRFYSNSGDNIYIDDRESINFQPNPALTNIVCTYSPTGVGTNISITGTNLGTHSQQGPGGLFVKGEKTQTVWSADQETISVQVPQRIEGQVPIVLRNDNSDEASGFCTVGLSTVSFTTNIQCRPPGNFSAANVDVKIYENLEVPPGTVPLPVISQKISLDNEGVPVGFNPKLEANKIYIMIIKPPQGVARRVAFAALPGTTILPFPILIPVGDIYPPSLPDGKVTSQDYGLMVREWALIRDVDRPSDLNIDKRVNSVDYACLRLNFNPPNNEDERYKPVTIEESPTPEPDQSPTPEPTATPSPGGG